MAITFRKALHGNLKGAINYIINPLKTDYKSLVTSHNCSIDFASQEIAMMHRHYKNAGNRTGYHAIQSFSPDENISPEEAHAIAVELATTLYKDYQCVISTHVDQHHIHNHMILSSLNLKTKHKLIDRLNDPGGLYALRELSDNICLMHVKKILDGKKITSYKTNDYINYATASWRTKIKKDIDELIPTTNNYEHLLSQLKNYGYDIKFGKYTSIRPIGKERYVRLTEKSLGKNYSENYLKNYFRRNKNIHYTYRPKIIKNRSYYPYKPKNRLLIALGFKRLRIFHRHNYFQKRSKLYTLPKSFYETSNKIAREISSMDYCLSILNKYDIHSLNNLTDMQNDIQNKINQLQSKHSLLSKQNRSYQEGMLAVNIIKKYGYLDKMKNEITLFEKNSFKNAYKHELALLDDAYKHLNNIYPIISYKDVINFSTLATQTRANVNMVTKDINELQSKFNELDEAYQLISGIDSIDKQSKVLEFEISIPIDQLKQTTQDYYVFDYLNKYTLVVNKHDCTLDNKTIYLTKGYIQNEIYTADELKKLHSTMNKQKKLSTQEISL